MSSNLSRFATPQQGIKNTFFYCRRAQIAELRKPREKIYFIIVVIISCVCWFIIWSGYLGRGEVRSCDRVKNRYDRR